MSSPPTIYIDNQFGTRLVAPNDWSVLEYTRTENNVGTLVLKLPANNYPRSFFYKDGIIEVWRTPDSGAPYLDTNTVWLIRKVQYIATPPAQWEITAYDLNHLLTRRIVDYNPGNVTYTELLLAADDMGKLIISQNFGAGALDQTRSISSYLNIQASTTLAPVVRKSISRQEVLKVLQDIALASYQSGTYLVFDIVCVQPAPNTGNMKFEFRSYVNQLGTNRTKSSGAAQYLLGPDFGNLANAVVTEDSSKEITRGIATGQGVDVVQAVARVDDLIRQGESPFGLIEGVRSSSAALVASDLIVDAQSELRSGLPIKTLTGNLASTSGFQYGINWNWGDTLTQQVNGISVDCRVSAVHVKYDLANGESVDPTLVAVVP